MHPADTKESPDPPAGRKERAGWSSVRIRTKLAVMLLIPAITLAGMVVFRQVESFREVQEVGETAEVVRTAEVAAEAVHAIQDERQAAALLVYQENTGLGETDELIGRFDEGQATVDESLDRLDEVRDVPELDADTLALLDRADKPLDSLQTARRAVHDGTVEEVHLTVYNSLVTRLMAVIDHAVDVAGTAELSRELRTASLLAAIDEHSEQLRVLVLGLEDGEPLAGDYRPFMRLTAAREEALSEYRRFTAASDPDASVFEVGGLGSAEARPANGFESQVAGSRSDDEQDIDHERLMGAYDARHAATAELVDQSLGMTVETATSLRDSVMQRLIMEGSIAVLALLLTVLVASGIGRSVTKGLRNLATSARRIAMVDLPGAVRHVDEQEGLQGLSPSEFAARTPSPLRVKGSDELAEVGEAFNIVHREAIRVSAQQALLRYHVGAIFIRLARRGHSLTGRLTAELDDAERNEQDPDRLQRLFRLDHLISLVSRANDSLLVLGGASAAKVRTNDEKIGDVLYAAQSRIEYYTRIELMSDDGAWVHAEAVDDVVQLLAELMDNATRYSEGSAEITARVLTGRAVIQVRDRGIGIDAERMAHLNDRLRRRAPVDLEAMQAMGLTVVGHLANRHGIEVELRETVGGGTVAEVAIPGEVLSIGKPRNEGKPPAPTPDGSAPVEEPLIRRRNAPLFEKANTPAPPVVQSATQLPPQPPAPPNQQQRRQPAIPAQAAPPPAERVAAPLMDPNADRVPAPLMEPNAERVPAPLIVPAAERVPAPLMDPDTTPIPSRQMREQETANLPVIMPPKGIAAAPAPNPRPLTAIESGRTTGTLADHLPALKFDVQYVHADPSLRAGHPLPAAIPAAPALTEGGLPRRQPMSNLVPGAIAPTAENPNEPIQRDPRTIGATYSAYARGLSGSRSQSSPSNEPRTNP